MGVALLSAASGLNKADQQTVQDWMVKGHSIMNGKVAGTVPDRADSGVNLEPGETWTIPRGYYDGTGIVKAGTSRYLVKTANWSINKTTSGSQTLTQKVSVDFSELGLSSAPTVLISFSNSVHLYGQDNGNNYARVGSLSVTNTTASATVSYQYIGSSIGNGSGDVQFVIIY